jgi:hypothetical protein
VQGNVSILINVFMKLIFRSRIRVWRKSADARLLRLWDRLPSLGWMFVLVNVVCCAGGGLCDGPSPRLEESYRVCACRSVIRYNDNPLRLRCVGRKILTIKI